MNEQEILALLEGAEPDVRIGFILTEEGRVWNDDGLHAATKMVDDTYPHEENNPAGSGILWQMGAVLNDPEFLASLLDKRPDAYVILSMSPESILLENDGEAGRDYAALIRAVAGNYGQDATSWQILSGEYRAFLADAGKNA